MPAAMKTSCRHTNSYNCLFDNGESKYGFRFWHYIYCPPPRRPAPPPHISKDLLKNYSLVWLKLYQVLQITPPVSSHPSHPYPPTTYLQELRFSFDKANLSWHILAPNCFPRPKTTTIWQQVVWSFSFDIFFGLFEMKLLYNYKSSV